MGIRHFLATSYRRLYFTKDTDKLVRQLNAGLEDYRYGTIRDLNWLEKARIMCIIFANFLNKCTTLESYMNMKKRTAFREIVIASESEHPASLIEHNTLRSDRRRRASRRRAAHGRGQEKGHVGLDSRVSITFLNVVKNFRSNTSASRTNHCPGNEKYVQHQAT